MIRAIDNLSQIATLSAANIKDGRRLEPADLSVVENATIIYSGDEILWVGETGKGPDDIKVEHRVSRPGHVLTPALVDSHTHLVFGGDRSKEYTMRLNGKDYQEIADAGGGILNTMDATTIASAQKLFDSAVQRVERLYSYGVRTVEVKSGYALTYEGEKKLTQVISRLKTYFLGKVRIHNTFMAAHAVPSIYKDSKEYLNQVVLPLMKEMREDIDSVDIFFEKGYFTQDDTLLLFDAAKNLKLPFRIHADEFNDNKGGLLAGVSNFLSADHLLCTGQDGIEALASSTTVATLLPGTAFFLGKPLADARAFLDAGVKLALASDYNPGSCHCDNLLLIANISAKSLRMNIAELWAAITLNAAAALGESKLGALIPGHRPEFALFQADSIDQITYSWGQNLRVEV